MKILIAEDDFTSRAILTAVLKKHGHDVVVTVNGAEACHEMQKSDAPGLAILDWMMPEMDGLEVCRCIRTIKTDRPPYLIILTSKDEKADIVAGLEAGADDYLAKPFDPGELRARVEVGRRIIELQANLSDKVQKLEKALSEVKTLSGLIPICASCKKIRDDLGFWNQVEAYISDNSDARFTHSICPDCVKKLYPELADDKWEENDK
jgi:phosphoserine phosphatase RsbU/P